MGAIRWDRAECQGLKDRDEVFFPKPGRPKKVPPYVKICGACEIKYSCLSYAIVHDEEGIWGGMTKDERDSLGSQVKESLTEEAIRQGWWEDHSKISSLLDRLATTPEPHLDPVETLEDDFLENLDEPLVPEVWTLPPLEYFDLLESGGPLVESLNGHSGKQLSDVQRPYFRNGPFSDSNEFLLPPSPFDDTNLNSMQPLGI